MKKCPYCKIEVGGNPSKCPLCQSRLSGEGEEMHFPAVDALKVRSFIYKLQMLIILSTVIIGLGLDFFYKVRIPGYPKLHWSLLVAMWLLAFEFFIMRQFRPDTGSARKVTLILIVMLIMLLVTAHYLDFMWLALDWVVPIVLAAMMITNFVLAMIDKRGNTMAYLLSGSLFGLLPCIIRFAAEGKMSVTWLVCSMVGTILLVAAIIFRGRAVFGEIQRRFNL